MKIKNQILNIILIAFIAIVTFSCSTSDDNKEVVVPKLSILDVAKANPDFSSLVLALKVSGLDLPGASPLGSAGSYTVFAPTNNAFTSYISTKFPSGASPAALIAINDAIVASIAKPATATTPAVPAVPLTQAFKDQITELKIILQNHILGTAIKSGDIVDKTYIKTFAPYNNSAVTLSMYITLDAGVVKLNGGAANGGSKVITADVVANNGIIHVIENVLLLPTIVSQIKANPSQFSTLLSVVTSGATGAFGDQSAVLTALSTATGNPTYDATTNLKPSLTVYAPNNDAFTAATVATTGYFSGADFSIVTPPATTSGPNGPNFTKVLLYHVQNGNFPAATTSSFSSATATADQNVTTLSAGQKFKIIAKTLNITENLTQSGTAATDAKATILNIQASNGVIFSINRVLKPVL